MRLNSFSRRLSLYALLFLRSVQHAQQRLHAFCSRRLSWRFESCIRESGGRLLSRDFLTQGLGTLFIVGSAILLMGTSNCPPPDEGEAAMLGVAASRLNPPGGVSHPQTSTEGRQTPLPMRRAAVPSITGADGSQTGTASFLGNFTAISAPPAGFFGLVRLSDCSLDLITIDSSNATTASDIPHYEDVLHRLASLTTTPNLFPNGCVDKDTGISSRPGVYVGLTQQKALVFAGVGQNGNNNVFLYSYNGTLTETTETSLSYASALATADLNGDGNGDLVVVNGAAAPNAFVSVMLGNADGSFQAPVNYPTSSVAGDFSVAAVLDDVNGDGKLDIVTVSFDQQISVLLGNGDGTFQPAQTFAAPTLPGYTSATQTPIVNLITADLRSIGRKDIIGSNGLVLLNGGNVSGNPTFAATAAPAFPYTQGLNSEGPNLASGDLNNDGKPDLVLSTGSGVSTWLGNGDGTFKRGNAYASINDTGFVTVTDLDGDGNADIYVGLANGGMYSGDDSNNAAAYVLMGHGDGTFAGAPTTGTGAYTGNNLGDVNGDGIPDLITNGVGQYSVQLGTGKGTFSPVSTIPAPASFVLGGISFTGGAPSAYAVADVNGDGFADLVFVDQGLTANGTTIYPTPVYFVALSNGDGTFSRPCPTCCRRSLRRRLRQCRHGQRAADRQHHRPRRPDHDLQRAGRPGCGRAGGQCLQRGLSGSARQWRRNL